MTGPAAWTWLLVLAGGMVGAPARYLLDRWVQAWHGAAFPWGTWTVNLAGSALLGLLAAGALPAPAMAWAGTGFCGALTTYSTLGYETVRLVEAGRWGHAALHMVGNLAGGLGAAVGGAAAATALWG